MVSVDEELLEFIGQVHQTEKVVQIYRMNYFV